MARAQRHGREHVADDRDRHGADDAPRRAAPAPCYKHDAPRFALDTREHADAVARPLHAAPSERPFRVQPAERRKREAPARLAARDAAPRVQDRLGADEALGLVLVHQLDLEVRPRFYCGQR